MLRLLADENFNAHIVRGVLRRNSSVDFVTVQEVGLEAADDEVVLAWAADHARLLVTHDVNSLVGLAYQRVASGLPMPGVVAVPRPVRIGRAVHDLLVIVECSLEGEWEGQVVYLPL